LLAIYDQDVEGHKNMSLCSLDRVIIQFLMFTDVMSVLEAIFSSRALVYLVKVTSAIQVIVIHSV
jgi:hypothetical protein